MKKNLIFLNKRCKLTYVNDFVLIGVVIDIDDYGLMFQTDQKSSFIAWNNIAALVPLE